MECGLLNDLSEGVKNTKVLYGVLHLRAAGPEPLGSVLGSPDFQTSETVTHQGRLIQPGLCAGSFVNTANVTSSAAIHQIRLYWQ